MAITRKQLAELVKAEAKKLRALATPQEKKNLNINTLDPNAIWSCIYGQMTGSCDSQRSIELIRASCPIVIKFNLKKHIKGTPYRLGVISKSKNGNQITKGRIYQDEARYFSPIEMFILREENKESNNAKLIKYLKGETKTLNFK